MAIDIAVLVSVGRHPASGRTRRAEGDATAVQMALELGRDHRIHLIHAGNPDERILRDYLGMGVPAITVLRVPERSDVIPSLVSHLKQLGPDLVLTGTQTEHGPSSGYLPYGVAKGLDYPIVPAIAGLTLEGKQAQLLQALPRGRRRAVTISLPLVATVDKVAAVPRQSAFGKARRGHIAVLEGIETSASPPPWEERPARRRPKRLKVMAGGSAEQRLKAASQMKAGKGAQMINPDPDEAARAIYDYLVEEGIIKPEP
jgi:electron transfer flavoprotein beta subunit